MKTCKSVCSFKHKKEQGRVVTKVHWALERRKVPCVKMSSQSNRSN